MSDTDSDNDDNELLNMDFSFKKPNRAAKRKEAKDEARIEALLDTVMDATDANARLKTEMEEAAALANSRTIASKCEAEASNKKQRKLDIIVNLEDLDRDDDLDVTGAGSAHISAGFGFRRVFYPPDSYGFETLKDALLELSPALESMEYDGLTTTVSHKEPAEALIAIILLVKEEEECYDLRLMQMLKLWMRSFCSKQEKVESNETTTLILLWIFKLAMSDFTRERMVKQRMKDIAMTHLLEIIDKLSEIPAAFLDTVKAERVLPNVFGFREHNFENENGNENGTISDGVSCPFIGIKLEFYMKLLSHPRLIVSKTPLISLPITIRCSLDHVIYNRKEGCDIHRVYLTNIIACHMKNGFKYSDVIETCRITSSMGPGLKGESYDDDDYEGYVPWMRAIKQIPNFWEEGSILSSANRFRGELSVQYILKGFGKVLDKSEDTLKQEIHALKADLKARFDFPSCSYDMLKGEGDLTGDELSFELILMGFVALSLVNQNKGVMLKKPPLFYSLVFTSYILVNSGLDCFRLNGLEEDHRYPFGAIDNAPLIKKILKEYELLCVDLRKCLPSALSSMYYQSMKGLLTSSVISNYKSLGDFHKSITEAKEKTKVQGSITSFFNKKSL